MRIGDYRDLIRALLQACTDWHACVNDAELRAWAARSARTVGELRQADCPLATPRDVEMRERALGDYLALSSDLAHRADVHALPAPAASSRSPGGHGTKRAAGYNKSIGRAVRLARAARSAKRRGYL